MKRILSTAALSLSFFAATAIAGEGYVTTNVDLRAGPDASYPDVAMLYAGTTVAIEGCVDGWSWCDVATADSRGWLPANYLQQEYQGQRVLIPEYGVRIGIPVISFVFGSYWDSYYRGRSWYGNREHWSQVTPQYQTLVVHDHSRTSRASSQRTGDGARRSGVVTTQSSYQSRPARTTATRHSVTTEVQSGKYASRTKPVEHHTVESRAVGQQHSTATAVASQANHGSRAKQVERNTVESRPAPKPVNEHRAAKPKVIAEHKAAQPQAKKENPSKSATGKDPEQH